MTILSPAAEAVLQRLRVHTPAELARLTEPQVRSAWRCGAKTVEELRAWLAAAGLTFYGAEKPQEALPLPTPEAATIKVKTIITPEELVKAAMLAGARMGESVMVVNLKSGEGATVAVVSIDRTEPGRYIGNNKIQCPCGKTHPGGPKTLRYWCRATDTWRDVVK